MTLLRPPTRSKSSCPTSDGSWKPAMSLASSTRSAAQATFSAPRQMQIRWRLAGGSALLTLVILCGFAGAVGGLTSIRLHPDFEQEVQRAARVFAESVVYTGIEPDP